MKRFFCLFFLLMAALPVISTGQSVPMEKKDLPAVVLSGTEEELIRAINDYREKNGLSQIPVSVSLTYVAHCHVRDLALDHPVSGRCNLHSWSDDGPWSPCCYTGDHRKAPCMWDKPRELTHYDSEGYEIAYWTNEPLSVKDYAMKALRGWQRSPEHNDVILNRNDWKKMDWKAMGVGYYEGYAVVWFGILPDREGEPHLANE